MVPHVKKLNKMKVSLVSIFRDESKYLKEWIEFHLLVGIDYFHLVNNNSSDNYLDVLKEYIDVGIVTLYNMDIETTKNIPGKINEQIIVSHWIKKLNEIAISSSDDWMVHVSTDEFLFPTNNETIKDVLLSFDNNVGEVSVNWTLFGNNNVTLSDGELLIEKLYKSSYPDHEHNYHVKPIFRPKGVISIPSVHFTSLKPGFIKVDAMGNPHNFKNGYEVKNRVLSPLHINHYRLRDLSWTDSKLKIYELWGREEFFDLYSKYNDVENYNVNRFVNPLKNKLVSI